MPCAIATTTSMSFVIAMEVMAKPFLTPQGLPTS